MDDTPATLDLYDVTGRRMESQPLGSLGQGEHVVSLTPRGSPWTPGVYTVKLTQGSHSAFGRVAIVR
jgi:hypothetical protein